MIKPVMRKKYVSQYPKRKVVKRDMNNNQDENKEIDPMIINIAMTLFIDSESDEVADIDKKKKDVSELIGSDILNSSEVYKRSFFSILEKIVSSRHYLSDSEKVELAKEMSKYITKFKTKSAPESRKRIKRKLPPMR